MVLHSTTIGRAAAVYHNTYKKETFNYFVPPIKLQAAHCQQIIAKLAP